MNRCRVELVYDAMGKPFPIGVTFDPKLIVLAKRQILKEAQDEYDAVKDLDEVLKVEHYGNLRRLEETLAFLIPREVEEIILARDDGHEE